MKAGTLEIELITNVARLQKETYTFLANGHGPTEGLEYLFRAGERIRLRVINGSAQSFFNVRIAAPATLSAGAPCPIAA